jgi:kumamolisin
VPPDELRNEASKFLRLAAIGVTSFVSSGDRGSNPSPPNCLNKALTVEYEASDSWVIAVGGTTLDFDTQTGKVLAETGWIGSGGGVSGSTSRPVWQPTYAPIAAVYRMVPDVSSVADNNPGAFLIYNNKVQGVRYKLERANMGGVCGADQRRSSKTWKTPSGISWTNFI